MGLEQIELYRMTGWVLEKRMLQTERNKVTPYMEAIINEKIDENLTPRKVLLPYEMFAEKCIFETGMPFIFIMYQKGGQIVSEVNLEECANKVAMIPHDIQMLLDTLEDGDNQHD